MIKLVLYGAIIFNIKIEKRKLNIVNSYCLLKIPAESGHLSIQLLQVVGKKIPKLNDARG